MRLDAENLPKTKVGYVPGSFYIEATDYAFHTGTPRVWIVAGNLAHHDALYYLGQYRGRAPLFGKTGVEYKVYQEGVR